MIAPSSSVLVSRTVKQIKANAPEILTALGASGVVTTSYLAVRAGFKAASVLSAEDTSLPMAERNTFKTKAKRTWKCYIPAAISGAATIGCIVAAGRGSNRRAAAAATAYSLTERAFNEYREKVVEQIGHNKEQKIRDDLAQEEITRKPPSESQLVMIGPGDVLCCELYTGRYFKSDMETLRRAMNEINSRALKDQYVALDEFYDLVGLDSTSGSSTIGWTFEKLMELEFSTCLTPSGEPCLSFRYNYVKPL